MKDHHKTMQSLDKSIQEANAKLMRLKRISKAMKDRFELVQELNKKLDSDYGIYPKVEH